MQSFSDEWHWAVIVGGIIGFICAFGIGANDLANSFGSSVGTKALTMWQCVIVAAVCEFSGALLLGAGVTDTIRSGVSRVTAFQNSPEILLAGMLVVMMAGAFWDNFACHLGLPVSTTHTTIGAIIGMSLVSYGSDAVVWWRRCSNLNKYCGSGSKGKQSFPVKGFVPIMFSWFASPICAGILVSIFYWSLRFFVLRSENSFYRALFVLPWCVGFTFGIIIAFIIQTGVKNDQWDEFSDAKVAWISTVAGGIMVVITYIFAFTVLKSWVLSDEEAHNERISAKERALEDGGKFRDGETEEEKRARIAQLIADVNYANRDVVGERIEQAFKSFGETTVGAILLKNPVSRLIFYGSTYDVHEHGLNDEEVARIWAHAEIFDFKTERLFRYLQVFSACVMSFAHGSNDVANAMGPFSAVVYIADNGRIPKKSPVPKWILALGGIGIVTGLATYGYHITRVLGVKAVKLTNTRGFCAELATAFVVTMASRFGLPISTTQTIVGAIFALGLFEGLKGVNWKLLGNIFGGWVMTLVIAGGIGALVQVFIIHTPNINASSRIDEIVNEHFFPDILAIVKQLQSNTSLPSDLASQIASFNSTLYKYSKVPYNYPGLAALQSKVLDVYNSTTCSN